MTIKTINEQYLTDIANSIRAYTGETRVEDIETPAMVPVVRISKTSNAISFTEHDGGYATNLDTYDVVRLEGAVRLNVKIAYQTQSMFMDWVEILEGEVSSSDAGYGKGNNKLKTEELQFDTDTITFHFKSHQSCDGVYLGYYAEITGFDADGNPISEEGTILVPTEVKNTYTVDEMAAAIESIECNGLHMPESALTVTGDCSYRFSSDGWSWFLEDFGEKIKTKDISNSSCMFSYSTTLKSIPFDMNFLPTTYYSMSSMFIGCKNLEEIGDIVDAYPSDMSSMFSGCNNLRYLPKFVDLNMGRIHANSSSSIRGMFTNCYSLRSIPEEFLKQLCNPSATSYLYVLFSSAFNRCYALDELIGLNPHTGTITSDMFSSSFFNCSRVKDIVFALEENGDCYKANWKSQTIELDKYVGFADKAVFILNYNSGITADKEVTDDASYQALKDDVDWFTTSPAYSRFNKESAKRFIASLPDTSAYLATAGGTNTIKFKGDAGSKTDGGAINTLTSEEIAIAASRGWTISFV